MSPCKNASTIIGFDMRSIWDEAKRQTNFVKHGLDFADADLVLDNPLKLDVERVRHGELRRQAYAHLSEVPTVLAVIYVAGQVRRIISFRHAARSERKVYRDWLENNLDDPG